VILALALPAAAAAQDWVTVPALGHPVALPIPFAGRAAPEPDYRAADPAGLMFIAEWVPAGEHVQDWSQMLTLTAQRHAEGRPNPATEGIDLLEGRYRAGCASPPELVPMAAGAPDRRAAVLVCAQVLGADFGEAMVALAVAGPAHLFTLQWAERFPAGGKERPAAATWADRLRLLDTARFQGARF
jgi:hypothetical protein